jgi:hypothetical protein
MRVSALLIALIALAPGAGFAAGPDRAGVEPRPAANCPQTTSHVATQKTPYRGGRLQPQKLTELPPATTYMAVYRRIAGCEEPLTMAEYRNSRRR